MPQRLTRMHTNLNHISKSKGLNIPTKPQAIALNPDIQEPTIQMLHFFIIFIMEKFIFMDWEYLLTLKHFVDNHLQKHWF